MTAAAVESAPAPVARGLQRRAAGVVISLLVGLVGLVSLVLLAEVPHANAVVADYNASTPYRCGHAAPPPGVACWSGVDGSLSALRTDLTALGVRQTVASVTVAGVMHQIDVQQSGAVACATPGEPVVLRTLGGDVTSVFTPHGTIPTAVNPNIDSDALFEGGIALAATALIIPAGVILAALRRRRLGVATDAATFYRAPALRWAALVFLVGQAADVATSAIGQAVGLTEGNALVDSFVRVTGPAGFALFRLPAIVLVLLGVTQVPRRIAVALLVVLGIAFATVGAHNAALAAGIHGVAGACATVKLP